ncbi:hypothetical protein GQ600_3192 [Phytophthora cactorum]|nr:hypothetical protein GQ600_3192 [Phytophthora cactorum]
MAERRMRSAGGLRAWIQNRDYNGIGDRCLPETGMILIMLEGSMMLKTMDGRHEVGHVAARINARVDDRSATDGAMKSTTSSSPVIKESETNAAQCSTISYQRTTYYRQYYAQAVCRAGLQHEVGPHYQERLDPRHSHRGIPLVGAAIVTIHQPSQTVNGYRNSNCKLANQ